MRDEPYASVERRVALEQEPEGLEAAHRVLRRVGPVDAEDHDLGSLGSERLPSFVDALVCGEPGERLGVDGERIRMRAQLGFVAATEQRLARLHERRAPALRVEPDAVAGQDALVDRGGDVRREHAPCVGPDPGDVDERGDACLWPNGADEGGRDVEVVVLHEQRRARVPVQLVDGGGREAAIDGDVAVCPRVREIGAPDRASGPTARAARTRAPGWRPPCRRAGRPPARGRRDGDEQTPPTRSARRRARLPRPLGRRRSSHSPPRRHDGGRPTARARRRDRLRRGRRRSSRRPPVDE